MDKRTTITIDNKQFEVEADDLEKICVLGQGAYGIVEKMCHKPSGTIMAVKVIMSYKVFANFNASLACLKHIYCYISLVDVICDHPQLKCLPHLIN